MKPQKSKMTLSQRFFEQLSENNNHWFAAQEARRRGLGGIGNVSKEQTHCVWDYPFYYQSWHRGVTSV